MPVFDFKFTLEAPVEAVVEFHRDTRALKALTPPPMRVQIHRVEPLAEGSTAEFTLWFGPLPIRWEAVHSGVGADGFTDTQVSGPMRSWRHTHRFTSLSEQRTQVHEHIEYQHHDGLRGLFSRLLFFRAGLYALFTARKVLTRRHLRRRTSHSAV